MCECGCGEYCPAKEYSIRGCVVGIELYPGCRDCDTGLAIVPHFFKKGSPFVMTEKPQSVTPDEDGACLPMIPIFDVEDLKAAFKEQDCQYDPTDADGYATLDDYLDDYGLSILQKAIEIRRGKSKKGEKE